MCFFTITALGIGFIFLSSTLGAALVYCFKKEFSKKINAIFLGLASGVMIAASVWSLLLPAFEKLQNGWGRYAFIPISISFLLGAALLWILDKLLPTSHKNSGLGDAKTRRLFFCGHLAQYSRKLSRWVCLWKRVGNRYASGVFIRIGRSDRYRYPKLSRRRCRCITYARYLKKQTQSLPLRLGKRRGRTDFCGFGLYFCRIRSFFVAVATRFCRWRDDLRCRAGFIA